VTAAPSGVRLGVDVGSVRVGVAASDPRATMALPVVTLRRDTGTPAALAALVAEREAAVVYVGLPRSLDGGEGPAAAAVRTFAGTLAAAVAPCPVRLVDERLTTAAAQQRLRESGVSSRASRAVVDQVAAVAILETALAGERTLTSLAGEPVEPEPEGVRR
jgi:putative Holliday junction resolvase